MNNLHKKVLKAIGDQQVTPKPKWHFTLMRAGLWLSVGITTILGSLAVGIIFREVARAPWQQAPRLMGRGLPVLVSLVPIIWLITVGLMTWLAYYLFRQTKQGYKYDPFMVVAGSVIISLALGGLMYATKTAQRVDDVLQRNIPPYLEHQMRRQQQLLAPEHGILVGEILERSPRENEILLTDPRGVLWHVNIQDLALTDRRQFQTGVRLMVIGEVAGHELDVNYFQAREIKSRDEIVQRMRRP